MPVAYSYIRMSRPEQLRGDSLRRQTEAAERWAAARGVAIDDTIRDIGVSAYRGKNRTEGALAEFLRMVEDGRVARGSYLIVESLDRLSREAVLDTLPRFMDLIKAGVTIVTLMDNQEYSTARLTADWTPLILSLAVMARAHEESRTKGVRVREAWDKKRAAAAEKVLTARVPAWLAVEDGRVVTLPKREKVVQRIFRESAAGDGRRAIVRRLNAEGVPPFAGAAGWQPSYVAKLLANRAVLGEFQAHRRDAEGRRRAHGEPVPGYFPVVVPAADFHAANLAKRSRSAAPGRRGNEVTNLFLGLAKCACGAAMALENKGAPPKGGRYLVCSSAARSAGCGQDRRWRLDKVEASALRALAHADLSDVEADAKGRTGGGAEPIEADLADARSRKERLLDLVEAGDADAAGRVRGLTARIADLERGLVAARTSEREAAAVPTYQEQGRLLGVLLAEMANATGEARREVRTRVAQALRTALERLVFHPNEIVGHYRDARMRYRFPRPMPRADATMPNFARRLFYDGPSERDPDDFVDHGPEAPRTEIPAAWRERAEARRKATMTA